MKRTSMTRDEQERFAVSYLAGNLSREETQSPETSITVQAFADFFAAQWPRTFNKMAFAAKVRAVAGRGDLCEACVQVRPLDKDGLCAKCRAVARKVTR